METRIEDADEGETLLLAGGARRCRAGVVMTQSDMIGGLAGGLRSVGRRSIWRGAAGGGSCGLGRERGIVRRNRMTVGLALPIRRYLFDADWSASVRSRCDPAGDLAGVRLGSVPAAGGRPRRAGSGLAAVSGVSGTA